jgi:hypothetical protein
MLGDNKTITLEAKGATFYDDSSVRFPPPQVQT